MHERAQPTSRPRLQLIHQFFMNQPDNIHTVLWINIQIDHLELLGLIEEIAYGGRTINVIEASRLGQLLLVVVGEHVVGDEPDGEGVSVH